MSLWGLTYRIWSLLQLKYKKGLEVDLLSLLAAESLVSTALIIFFYLMLLSLGFLLNSLANSYKCSLYSKGVSTFQRYLLTSYYRALCWSRGRLDSFKFLDILSSASSSRRSAFQTSPVLLFWESFFIFSIFFLQFQLLFKRISFLAYRSSQILYKIFLLYFSDLRSIMFLVRLLRVNYSSTLNL